MELVKRLRLDPPSPTTLVGMVKVKLEVLIVEEGQQTKAQGWMSNAFISKKMAAQ